MALIWCGSMPQPISLAIWIRKSHVNPISRSNIGQQSFVAEHLLYKNVVVKYRYAEQLNNKHQFTDCETLSKTDVYGDINHRLFFFLRSSPIFYDAVNMIWYSALTVPLTALNWRFASLFTKRMCNFNLRNNLWLHEITIFFHVRTFFQFVNLHETRGM